jgi:hypothetical protein
MIEGHAETVLEFPGSGPVYWCAISHRTITEIASEPILQAE